MLHIAWLDSIASLKLRFIVCEPSCHSSPKCSELSASRSFKVLVDLVASFEDILRQQSPARLCCDAQLVWRFAWPCRLHLALWLLPVALQRPGPFLSILILVQLKRQPVLKTGNENTSAHIFDATRPCFEVGSACGFQRTRPGATCTKLMHANLIWRLQAIRMPSPPRN